MVSRASDCTPENIIQHLKNIYAEEELLPEATAKKFLVVRKEDARNVRREIEHYKLDAIMSMKDWLAETDRFLMNNRRNVLEGKGSVSHDDAVNKVSGIYAQFRKKQDAEYISEFDRETAKYLRGEK